ncbi:MAG: ribonuclease HII [Sulfolobales archaeon]|nr:ribonuclease HII [Sulfolobales archaeon]MCX8198921.1 ribonuclease HII [Sulfolobales archaeon]MDW8169899.1 ribonuclease HII [Desulfurococcaceae archaeon]
MGESIPLTIGIDEAGRGPVIGEMFIALVAIPLDNLKYLKDLGVMDSKLLTPQMRSQLVPSIIKQSLTTLIISASPIEIDLLNLNVLEWKKILVGITALAMAIDSNSVKRIVIDMVRGFRENVEYIKRIYPHAEVIVEERADYKYIEVSAASIIAKYYRDLAISGLRRAYGDIGSGYPRDPKTIKWLREAYKTYENPPQIIRRSWSSLKDIAPKWYLAKKVRVRGKQRSLLEFIH